MISQGRGVFNTETVPVVIGALGLLQKGLGKYVEKNPWKHQYRGTPKISLLGIAHRIQKVLSTN